MHIRRTEDLAALLRSARRDRGLSQQALAERLGVSRKWVSEFELGNSSAEIGLVLRALNELQIAVAATIGQPTAARAGAVPTLDIDAIADTGLSPATDRRRRS